MEQKKTFKERCAEAKAWWDEHHTQIGAAVIIFLTGTVFGIVKGAKMNRDYLDCTIKASLSNGYEQGRRGTINDICNRIADTDEPIKFNNHDTGESLYIGKVDAPEEESEEA